MKVDKTKFKDAKGRYIVQGLFLEDSYNPEMAVYTFSGEDKEYKGGVFPSLKRLYLEEGDPIEYTFASKYLFDWDHWQRLCKNAIIGRHVEKWRDELSLALQSDGIQAIINSALTKDHFQAAKYLADRGWDVKERGRPSNEEIEGELKRRADSEENFKKDFELLSLHNRKSK